MTLKQIPPPSFRLVFLPESDTEYVHFEDAHMHPFERDAAGLSRVNAWWCADASLLAYWDGGAADAIWRAAGFEHEFLSKDGVQCHVAWTEATIIVAFRGTEPTDWRDIVDIARVRQATWRFGAGAVHEGFLDGLERIWNALQKLLKDLEPARGIWFTGHSLGAALATLAMDRFGVARGIYTFGSPPVGNRRFASAFDQRHAGRSFRYDNHRDIVVHPPSWLPVLLGGYTHVQQRRYIDANGRILAGSTGIAERLSNWRALLMGGGSVPLIGDLRTLNDSLPVPDELVDHTPRRYAVHVWNDYVGSQPVAAPAPG